MKKSKIERLKEKLYSPKSKDLQPKPRGIIYEDPHEIESAWRESAPEAPHKKKKSLLENTMFRKFFIGAIGFFVLALIFGGYMFFAGSNTVSADNIDINVLGNAFTSGGEELPLKIQVVNRNNVALEYGDLVLEYQKGSGSTESLQTDRFDVGTVPAGGMVEKLLSLTLFGQQGTTRDVNITLDYRVKGSSAIFVKQKPYVVNISSTPVNLVIDGPDVTNSNQEISFNITTSLNTESAVKDMMVVVNYPPGFDFKSADPEPTFSDNIWSLGDLAKGAEKDIRINGVIVAEPGEQRAFNIFTGTADPKNEQEIGTQFNYQDYIIAIQKPFLDLAFAVNGSEDTEVGITNNDFADGKITFKNNLESKITDVEITAKFSGNAFDMNSVRQSGGFYDSTKQTIVWNSQTDPDLAKIDPGDKGELNFKFKPISFSGSNLKDPQVNVEVSVKGRQPALGNQFLDITNYVKKTVKYLTQLQINGQTLYKSGPFVNTGPLPPTPGTPTTYTISWSVANTTSRVTNAKARTTLPLYVDWVGAVSPNDQNVTYNSGTREVLWDIGTLEGGVGLSSSPRQVYFQVKLNPSGSQSGGVPNLILDTVLTAKDSFSGKDISRSIQALSTRLNRDSNYNPTNDAVK